MISFDEDGNKETKPALAGSASGEGLKVIEWEARVFETLHMCSEAISVENSLGKVQVEGNPKKTDSLRVYSTLRNLRWWGPCCSCP